jgi:hypothetical protein
MKPASRLRRIASAGTVAASLLATGCGTPGAPLPPSLNLPNPVGDLAAVRTGNQVALTWTMPKKSTDKLLLKGKISVIICRKDETEVCAAVPGELELAPAAQGAFTDTLPATLAEGTPRELTYFVELNNRNGRSAGLSNAAIILAGEAPAQVTGLTAQVRKDGVVLSWTSDPAMRGPASCAIRLHRKLLTPQPAKKQKPQSGLLAPQTEPVEQSLLVDSTSNPDRALDSSIRFGESYEYRAQRVARVTVGDQTLELAGPISDPVRVEALDIFLPAVPTGLAAVANPADPSANPPATPSIDLSWQPVTDSDLAGYAVYRREAATEWRRISPAASVVGPAFHDPQVESGHTYVYAVTAIDQSGHESARSAEAQETVPSP